MNRAVFASLTILYLLSVSSITGFIQVVKADSGTVYIRADGSIDPPTAPISSGHNATYTFYTFTGNISYPTYNGIVVERNNIVIDGNGYIVQGNQSGTGLNLTGVSNVMIENVIVEGFQFGIYLESSSYNTVSWNNATANGYGIELSSSSNNTVSGNNATANNNGIGLFSSSNNIVSGNNATANGDGIVLQSSPSNIIYHNNFIGNTVQASVDSASIGTAWNETYPAGGNYWSDYNGTDLKSGQYQNVTGSDGIGDTPYVIDANNTDDYPLMGAFLDFNVAQGVDVQVVSNSTISDFQFNGTAILFNVSGLSGTTGFCNVCVPTALLNGTLTVLVNGTQVQYSLLPISNSTNSYLYFTYSHSTEQVIIMPEFPSFLILPLFFIATLLAVIIYKKKSAKNHASVQSSILMMPQKSLRLCESEMRRANREA